MHTGMELFSKYMKRWMTEYPRRCVKQNISRQSIRCHSQQVVHLKKHFLTSNQIRQTFVDYFKSQHGHVYVPSSSVIPCDDPSLIFTNAGMNQFKDIFLGKHETNKNLSRVVNYQKCIRLGGKHNDLEDVGRDCYHHTFFEMLGNWSFGDYFKESACRMAWELLTTIYKLPPDSLYVTYFVGDSSLGLKPDFETRDIWISLGVPSRRVLPFGMKDNFWMMGLTGPCGPCTEIHYDHLGRRDAADLVNTSSPDVIELWNLVFTQYNQQSDGSIVKLPSLHVDTGMGLERLTAVIQGSLSNYDTDLFQPLFATIADLSGIRPYQGRCGAEDVNNIDSAYRILADHARMMTVSISDGVKPHWEGPGALLRMIIRRSILTSKMVFNSPEGLLINLAEQVAVILGEAYPNIPQNLNTINCTIKEEEQRIIKVIEKAMLAFDEVIPNCSGGELTGNTMFDLSERYALPKDLIVDLAIYRGLTPDIRGFEEKLESIKEERVTTNLEKKRNKIAEYLLQQKESVTDDRFKYENLKHRTSYTFPEISASVQQVFVGDKKTDDLTVNDRGVIILDKTCFMSKHDGQVSDIGVIVGDKFEFNIEEVEKVDGYVLHHGVVNSGSVEPGASCRLYIDQSRRQNCMLNRTCSLIMKKAILLKFPSAQIRKVYIRPDNFIVTFSFESNPNIDSIDQLERMVNEIIESKCSVTSVTMSLESALRNIPQLISSPTENSKEVHVVMIQSQGVVVAAEICSGIHVLNSADLGMFAITDFKQAEDNLLVVKGVTSLKALRCAMKGQELQEEVQSLSNYFHKIYAGRETLNLKTLDELREQIKILKGSLEDSEIPYLVRIRLNNKLEELGKENFFKIRAVKRNVAEQQVVEEVSQLLKNDGSYLIYSIETDGEERVLFKAISHLNIEKPVMILVHCLGKKKVACKCIVPEGKVTDEFNAQRWVAALEQRLGVCDVKILMGGREELDKLNPKTQWMTANKSVHRIQEVLHQAEEFCKTHL